MSPVRRHPRNAACDDALNVLDVPIEVLVVIPVDRRMISLRQDALADHDLDPARLPEHLGAVTEKQPLSRNRSMYSCKLAGIGIVRQ